MSRFRMPEVPRDQALLFATRLDDAIPEGHPVRHVLSLLQSEQVRPAISRLATTYSEGRGQPAYHPLYLVALYIHGMLIGERSSRRMEQACHNRIDVMWLMEGQHPDHSTIAGFQKRWSDELSELLKAIVLVARDAGLVKLGLVAVDGTKVAANAGKDSVKKKESLLRQKEAIDAKVKELEAEWEANEAQEAVLGGDTPWTPPEGTPEDQRRQYEKEQEALDEALKAIERRKAEASRGGSRVAEAASITDPEARRMKGKNGEVRPNYNGQVAVDDEAGIVVAVDVNDLADDSSQLRPMVEKVEEVVGEKPKAVVADSGYNTGKDIADLESAGVTTYLPDCGKSGRGNDEQSEEALQALVNGEELSEEQLKALPMGRNGKLSNQVFTYDAETDTYRCPMGEELPYFNSTKDHVKGGSVERRMYTGAKGCATCPLASMCCSSPPKPRIVSRNVYEEHRERQRERMNTPEGEAARKRRSPLVEGRIAHLQNLGLRRFLRRGRSGALFEWLLGAIALNVKILSQRWEVVSDVIGGLETGCEAA